MERRTAVGIVAVLALVCLAMVGSVLYPFDTQTAHGQLPEYEQFTAPEASEFHWTGQIVSDGQTVLSSEGTVVEGGPRYERTMNAGVTKEQYQPAPSEPVYVRLVFSNDETAGDRRESIWGDNSQTLLSRTHNGTATTLLVRQDETDIAPSISGTASVFTRSLGVTSYVLQSQGTPSTSVYAPQNGWYEGEKWTYRVTDATGEVVVNASTNAVQSTNVTRKLTVPAGTYAEYLVGTVVGDKPEHQTIRVSFDTGEQAIEQPSWVPESDE